MRGVPHLSACLSLSWDGVFSWLWAWTWPGPPPSGPPGSAAGGRSIWGLLSFHYHLGQTGHLNRFWVCTSVSGSSAPTHTSLSFGTLQKACPHGVCVVTSLLSMHLHLACSAGDHGLDKGVRASEGMTCAWGPSPARSGPARGPPLAQAPGADLPPGLCSVAAV